MKGKRQKVGLVITVISGTILAYLLACLAQIYITSVVLSYIMLAVTFVIGVILIAWGFKTSSKKCQQGR